MISGFNHPYVRWQLNNEDVPPLALQLSVSEGSRAEWEQLIANGIDLYATDSNGATPLHYAIFEGNQALSYFLGTISKIARYKIIDTGLFRLSIVDYAIYRGAPTEVITLLEKKRQSENILPSPWCTAIERAWADRKGFETLLKCAPFPSSERRPIILTTLKFKDFESLKMLFDFVPHGKAAADFWATRKALEMACTEGNCAVVESILKAMQRYDNEKYLRRFNLDAESRAETRKEQEQMPLRASWRVQDLLVEESEDYPLHCALRSGNEQLIEYLLTSATGSWGVSILAKKDAQGQTPLLIAAAKSLKSTHRIIAKYEMSSWKLLSLGELLKAVNVAFEQRNGLAGIFLRSIYDFLCSTTYPHGIFGPRCMPEVRLHGFVTNSISVESIVKNLFDRVKQLLLAQQDQNSLIPLCADTTKLVMRMFVLSQENLQASIQERMV